MEARLTSIAVISQGVHLQLINKAVVVVAECIAHKARAMLGMQKDVHNYGVHVYNIARTFDRTRPEALFTENAVLVKFSNRIVPDGNVYTINGDCGIRYREQ